MTEQTPSLYAANADVRTIEREQWSAATQDALQAPPPRPIPPEVVEDFDKARNNIQEISNVSMTAITDLGVLASQAGNDKFYAALASLLRAATEAQRDMMDLHKRKKDLIGTEAPKHVTNQVIMTSSEMLKMIKGEDK